MVDLMDEVAQDVRDERLSRAFKAYGPFVIATIVVVLAITGIIIVWNAYQANETKKFSTQYFAASNLAKESQNEQLASFEAMADMDKGGYGTLARFKVAQFQETFAPAKVHDVLTNIQHKSDAPASLKYFAEMVDIINQFDALTHEKAQALITRLQEIQKVSPPWDFMAKFLQSQLQIYIHQETEAKSLLTLLATAPEVPEEIATLAAAYLNALESQTTFTPTS